MKRLVRVKTGAEAGLLAGAAVALFFFVLDLLAIHPFSTPTALAARWFGPGGYEIDVSMLARASAFIGSAFKLAVYTVSHFLAFAALGALAGGVADWSRGLGSSLGTGALFGLTVCSAVFYGGNLLFGGAVLSQLPGLPSVLAANLVAGLVIGGMMHWAVTAHSTPD